MIFDIELLIKEVLNLLFFLGLSLTETFDELFLFSFIELRGPAAPEVRSEFPQSTLIPALNPVTGSSF